MSEPNALALLQKNFPAGADGAILLSETGRRYFTGFDATDGILLVTREAARLIIDFRYIEAARAAVKSCEVVLLDPKTDQVADFISENRIRTLAVESYELPVSTLMRLKRRLPQVAFDESDDFSSAVSALRMIKTQAEADAVRRAQKITDAAYEHILPMVKPGVTERSLSLEIEFFMKRSGASRPSFDLIVVSGEKTSLPHGVPGERKISAGDFVTMDTGAVVDGYCSDMTRTVAVGGVTDAQRNVYDTVLRAQLAALKEIRAGKVCRDIDRVARDIIEKDAGFAGCFGHGLGHSVGLEIHEEPRFSPACGTILKPGMFMTVEPGVYLEGKFGVRIEDLVRVTDSGCENYTQSPKELVVLPA